MKSSPVRWLVNDLWQLGKINAIAGQPKKGKSRLMAWILVGMSKGEVFGLAAMPKRILYLCGEEPVAEVNNRIVHYAKLQDVPASQYDISLVEAAGMQLDTPKHRAGLLEKMLDEDREMLVLDPTRRLHKADENDNTAMSAILNDVRAWSNKYNITVVMVHHTGKVTEDMDMSHMMNWFRGASDIPAILDTAQYVARGRKNEITLHRQGRFAPLEPLTIMDHGDEKGFERR